MLRTEEHEKFSGKSGKPAFLAQAQGPSGYFIGRNAYGDSIHVAYRRSPFSDWLIAASIKHSVLEAPLSSAWNMLAGFGLLLLIAMSLAELWM